MASRPRGDGQQILVVDDEPAVRTALRVNLTKAGYRVSAVESAEAALSHLQEHRVDLVITDVRMKGMSGIELLAEMREHAPDVPVIVMTGDGSVSKAVSAMQAGAFHYLIKPISRDEMLVIVERALRVVALETEVADLRARLADEDPTNRGFEGIIGATPNMTRVFSLVDAVAPSSALVLLTGPTGTGKELLAKAIHRRSERQQGAFVAVNCAALPEGLLESELFGHEKGSFTGAIRQHRGKFEQAGGGTLFLDEIGEIPLSTQVRLLRVLESGEFQRVGGRETLHADVRVIAATNRNLRDEVRAGQFREDLYYRLNVFHIPLPPLRERRDDIPLLVDHFLRRYSDRYRRTIQAIAPAAMRTLMTHSWPGNVRELEHAIERAVLLCTGEQVETVQIAESVPQEDSSTTPVLGAGQTLPDALLSLERSLIVMALRLEKGVQARAARRLGVSRSNLNYRIQKLEIGVQDITYE